jgi:hypothetical protein
MLQDSQKRLRVKLNAQHRVLIRRGFDLKPPSDSKEQFKTQKLLFSRAD